MYLIMNTAISHQWGMPEPCDIAHCATCWRCYDCTNPGKGIGILKDSAVNSAVNDFKSNCCYYVSSDSLRFIVMLLLYFLIHISYIYFLYVFCIFWSSRLSVHATRRNEELQEPPCEDGDRLYPLVPGMLHSSLSHCLLFAIAAT